jgi:hypothetical protein
MAQRGRSNRGSRHHLTKLTEADIPVIRVLLSEGLTQREIGARFGVSEDVIGFIKRGVSWAWVR